MKTTNSRASMEAKSAALRATVYAYPGAGVTVDMEKAEILNVSIMSTGEAKGHGFFIDSTTIQQVADCINAIAAGSTARFKHPRTAEPDGTQYDWLGTDVGYIRNARVDGGSVRGDVYLADYSECLPGLGNVKDYLLRKAKADPTGFGLSAVIGYDPEPITDGEGNVTGFVARVYVVDGVDFVSRPAANPHGLLSERQPKPIEPPAIAVAAVVPPVIPTNTPAPLGAKLSKGKQMDPKMKNYLSANHGLAADATDEDAQAMYDGLTADEQAKCSASMSEKPTEPTTGLAAKRTQVVTDEGDKLLAVEGKRVAQLQQLGNVLKVEQDVVTLAIANGDTVIDAKARFLKHLSAKAAPIGGAVRVGEDRNRASLVACLSDAIRMRAGSVIEKPADRATQMRALSLIEMGRHYLSASGVSDAFTLTRERVWQMLSRQREYAGQYAALAQSTGSFLNITLDAANKSLRQAYLDKPATWEMWARRATAPDFKNVNRIALSDSPGMASRAEGGEIKFNVMSDSKEVYAVTEYTSGIRLTRQAIINDDLDAFGRIPQLQGAAARRKEDDVVYAILTANAALADAIALFDSSTHKNYTSSGTVISVASLAVARASLRVQTGPKGAYLNLTPRFLIVPAALESIAEQYTSAQFVAAISSSVNPFASGMSTPLRPVVEPRLDASSATSWYLAAGNDTIDTVECCFLQDEPEPVLKQEVDFDTDDVKFAVRHTVAAKAIDYRGLYKNAGA